MKTLTWFSATHTGLEVLESRIPCYVLPLHMCLPDVTKAELQRVIVWSFHCWMTGRMPSLDHLNQHFPATGFRGKIAARDTEIAGGHTGVHVSTISDGIWMSQHYRFGKRLDTHDLQQVRRL